MRTLITGIGQVVSGDIAAPLMDADSIVIEDGRIAAIGRGLDSDADIVIDAHGTTVFPGLIDSHAHPVFGDFTPRQRTLDFIESSLHGGVTTVISAGEPHLPGRPRDIVGLKALAIAVARSYANFRPGGVKVRAGAPILELGLVEADFAEMAAGGVRLIGEIGLGSVKTGAAAAPMVAWGRAHGMVSTFHTGGPSLPGSAAVGADDVLEANPDVAGHVNGGTTSLSEADIERLVASDSGIALELVHCGNGRTALVALAMAAEAGALGRVILGNDAPSGTGVVPLGILRLMAHLASLGGIAPEIVVCLASGNTAGVHGLDTGVLAPGRAADLCVLDAPVGSVGTTALDALANGDLPGISLVMVDGVAVAGRSRNTAPAGRQAEVVKGPPAGGGGH
ncbi:MAG: amidohydrolase family protein [Chloroflexota bacterium]|jgi:enamidase|nr:amidohydrolase family protein [Chloroflexota bacterium]MDH5244182.1 amidohydrolase family protein [Chloroflexota bacterium]